MLAETVRNSHNLMYHKFSHFYSEYYNFVYVWL